jgi:hypothetical protein
MAIYPAIFRSIPGQVFARAHRRLERVRWSLAVVVLCCVWNLRGAPAVGEDSVGLFALLLAPFAVFVALGFWRWFTAASAGAMGHFNAWTGGRVVGGTRLFDGGSGGHVELHGLGQRLHRGPGGGESAAQLSPRHDLATILVAVTYIVPLAAMALAGLSWAAFPPATGYPRPRAARRPLLGLAVVAGGA